MTAALDPATGPVLLVGCGKLGTALAPRLRDRGLDVLALRRDVGGLPPDLPARAIDLAEPLPATLPRAAGMVITLPPTDAPDGYRERLQHLAGALPAVPARTVFVSSTRVFDGLGGPDAEARPLDEDEPPTPATERARTLVAGEEQARELFDAIVLRPAGIYGPGRDRLLRTVREGRPVEHRRRSNRIHQDDLVRTLELLLTHPAPPSLLHAVDDHPATLGEVVTHLARRMDLPVPPAAEPDPGGGTVLAGARLAALFGDLDHPDFRSGYDAMLAGDTPGEVPGTRT